MIKTTKVKAAEAAADKLIGDGDDVLRELVKNELLYKNDTKKLQGANNHVISALLDEQETIANDLMDIDAVFVHGPDGKLVPGNIREILNEFAKRGSNQDDVISPLFNKSE